MRCAPRLVGVAGSLRVYLSYNFFPFLARKGVRSDDASLIETLDLVGGDGRPDGHRDQHPDRSTLKGG